MTNFETDETSSKSELIISDQTVYNKLMERSGGRLIGEPESVEVFEKAYKKLNTAAVGIGKAYKDVCQQQFGFDPGEIDIVLGGGRVKNKPLKKDSDLDLFIFVERPEQSISLEAIISKTQSPIDAMDFQNIAAQKVKAKTDEICEELELPKLFHIMQYSAPLPKQYADDEEILIARVNTNEYHQQS